MGTPTQRLDLSGGAMLSPQGTESVDKLVNGLVNCKHRVSARVQALLTPLHRRQCSAGLALRIARTCIPTLDGRLDRVGQVPVSARPRMWRTFAFAAAAPV